MLIIWKISKQNKRFPYLFMLHCNMFCGRVLMPRAQWIDHNGQEREEIAGPVNLIWVVLIQPILKAFC